MLNFYEARLVYILREEFGCSCSRIKEILGEAYSSTKFLAYKGKDIVGYAYILLGKKMPDLDESELQSTTETLLEDSSGDSYEE